MTNINEKLTDAFDAIDAALAVLQNSITVQSEIGYNTNPDIYEYRATIARVADELRETWNWRFAARNDDD